MNEDEQSAQPFLNIAWIIMQPQCAFADFIFVAVRKILSLPHYHGARWSAWLRFACRKQNIDIECIKGLLPLRNTKKPVLMGERIGVRLLLAPELPDIIADMARAFLDSDPRGEFSTASLRLVEVRNPCGDVIWSPERGVAGNLMDLDADLIKLEAECLSLIDQWRLIFTTPLRLSLPRGKRGHNDIERFCPPAFFETGGSMRYLLDHIRFIESRGAGAPDPVSAKLTWHDLRYGENRHIAMGGIIGQLSFSRAPAMAAALPLVWGQYLGAGKNARFGMGFWRIPELDSIRRIYLP